MTLSRAPRWTHPLALALAFAALVLPPAAARAQGASAAAASPAPPAAGERRSLPPFEAITVRGAVDLVLRQSGPVAAWVQAPAGEAASVETRVVQRDGRATLEIDRPRAGSLLARQVPTVTVDWERLSALRVRGSGDVVASGMVTPALRIDLEGSADIHIDRLDTRSLTLAVAGSGDVRLAGAAPALSVSVAGSGDVDASALEADAVSVSVAGSGDVVVRARSSLGVSIAGSGDVVYLGNPRLSQQVVGSGSVARR